MRPVPQVFGGHVATKFLIKKAKLEICTSVEQQDPAKQIGRLARAPRTKGSGRRASRASAVDAAIGVEHHNDIRWVGAKELPCGSKHKALPLRSTLVRTITWVAADFCDCRRVVGAIVSDDHNTD